MKLSLHRRVLCAAVMALLMGHSAFADTVTEGFNTASGTVMPDGWNTAGSNSYYKSDRDTKHNAAPSIAAEGNNTTAYLITPMLQGDFNLWIRNYTKSYQATVTAYACTYNDGEVTLGNELGYEKLSKTSSGTPSWTNVKFNSPTATRVALLIAYAYIDDFTYTPGVVTAGPSLLVTDYANGDEYIFGIVPEGSQKTFSLVNQGTEELTINSIDATDGFVIVAGKDLQTIGAGENADVTVATPAKNAEGKLIIESNDKESPYEIILKSTYKIPAPVMEVSSTAIDFGKVTEDASRDIVIKNSGDAALTVSAVSNNASFVLSGNSLSVEPEAEATLTVTFKFDADKVGTNNGTLTLTNNAGDPVDISLTARVPDPNVWTEDFEGDSLPAGWELTGKSKWTVEDGVAKGSYNSVDKGYIVTPSLKVETTGDILSFQYRPTYSGLVYVKIEMSKDGADFKEYYKITDNTRVQEFKDYQITGLEPGTYRFRFENDDYELDNFEGFKLDNEAPKMEISPLTPAAFGKVTERPEGKIYTVTNAGTGSMDVTISSSSEDFSVSPTSLTNIEAGQEATFTVFFEYDVDNVGEKEATITVTPSYNEEAAVTIQATAISKDPSIWEEDFEEGKLPQGWSTTGWNVTNSKLYGLNGTYVAWAGISNNGSTLTTPRLYAEKDQELRFEVCGNIDSYTPLTVEYSNDSMNWKEMEGSPVESTGVQTFVAPETGNYYLRFKGVYGAVDNFYGFRLNMKEHDLSVAGQNIPVKGNQYVEYVATISVMEMMSKTENATAELYMNGNVVATETAEIGENETVTITLSFVPEQSVENAETYVLVSYAENETLKGETVNVTIAPAPVWDEDEEAEFEEGTVPVVILNYTPVAGWNTISVPFALDDKSLTQIFGESYLVYELKEYSEGIIKFQEALLMDGKYAAGYPYVVYVNEPDSPEIEEEAVEAGTIGAPIILENVKIERTEPQSDESKGVKFSAIFSKRDVEEGETCYELDSAYHSLKEATSLKGFRGYVTLDPSITKVPAVQFYDGSGQPTGVESVITEMFTVEGIYNLQGVKVTQPLSPGIYIINGKKTVIR